MKHKIEPTNAGVVDIAVNVQGQEQAKLLDGLQQCQSGNCGCPTREYEKLDNIDVAADSNGVRIRLEAKPNAEIDTQEVEKCLNWMSDQVKKG